jgi:cytochrome d ubiquinol oxidase subunit I
MGVVTGIVQEFQFGMNWASYSRFVGDVFGAPLAMEALVAFFLESTFLGLWIFGWDRLSPKVHLATIWAAAIGTTLSAYFIVAANSWMQHPVGVRYDQATGRAELYDIGAVLTNSTTLAAYPHVLAGALLTAAVFVGGISAWLLTREPQPDPADVLALHRAVRLAIAVTFLAGIAVAVSGHVQTRLMFHQQPMKMASAEALCDTESGAGLSLFAVGDVSAECDVRSVVVPRALSVLATDDPDATIDGVRDINADYSARFGEGDYRPNLVVSYWAFRAMILFGAIASFGAVVAWWLTRRGRELPRRRWVRVASIAVIVTPFLANATGWLFTEMGRQPWVVAPNPDGLPEVRLLTRDAVSGSVSSGMVLVTLVGFTLVYGALAVVELGLLRRYARGGLAAATVAVGPSPDDESDETGASSDGDRDDVLAFAY